MNPAMVISVHLRCVAQLNALLSIKQKRCTKPVLALYQPILPFEKMPLEMQMNVLRRNKSRYKKLLPMS